MSRTWTASIHVNERKIPAYDSIKDPYCVFTKSIPFSNHVKQFSKRAVNENKRKKFKQLGQSAKFQALQRRKTKKRKFKTARGRRLVHWRALLVILAGMDAWAHLSHSSIFVYRENYPDQQHNHKNAAKARLWFGMLLEHWHQPSRCRNTAQIQSWFVPLAVAFLLVLACAHDHSCSFPY